MVSGLLYLWHLSPRMITDSSSLLCMVSGASEIPFFYVCLQFWDHKNSSADKYGNHGSVEPDNRGMLFFVRIP